jgi:hypothetical protein
MKNRMTKKVKNEFFNLVKKYGYYSKEVQDFNSNLEHTLMCRLNSMVNRKTNKQF